MRKLIRPLFPAMLIAALCLPIVAAAQTDPGSLDGLLDADFEPLLNQTDQQLPELNAPLIMGPQEPAGESRLQLDSVLEVPRVTIDEPAPGVLVLPELTIPTPDNTAVNPRQGRRSLKPQMDVPPDPIELLPFDNEMPDLAAQPRAVQPRPPIPAPRQQFPPLQRPRMQTPQALNYGSRSWSSSWSSRSMLQRVPVQIEFFSTSRGFGYHPYGGYGGFGPPTVGYRPYGGYVPYGGYGVRRNCPYGR